MTVRYLLLLVVVKRLTKHCTTRGQAAATDHCKCHDVVGVVAGKM